jgi:hypothetical protein
MVHGSNAAWFLVTWSQQPMGKDIEGHAGEIGR